MPQTKSLFIFTALNKHTKYITMKCPNCGHETADDSIFCEHCGTKIEEFKTPENDQMPQQPKPISGWLAFFLWVGIGLGAVASCVFAFAELKNVTLTPLGILIAAGIQGSMLGVAIMTIIAFYKRKPNAVALAMTYIAMIAIDGVLQIIINSMVGDAEFDRNIVRSFIWAAVWFAYLKNSRQVAARIPAETREWKLPERLLLLIYIISSFAFCAGLQQTIDNPQKSYLFVIEQDEDSYYDEYDDDYYDYYDDDEYYY